MSTTTSTIQAWTTENSNAVVWGTHDLEQAKAAYREQVGSGWDEPDWGDCKRMWGAPHLVELEQWDTADYGDEPKADRVPYMVYGF